MPIVTIQQAKANVAHLIQRTLAGEDIIVAKGKNPVEKNWPYFCIQKRENLWRRERNREVYFSQF